MNSGTKTFLQAASLAVVLTFVSAPASHAQTPGNPQRFVDEVFQRLLSVAQPTGPGASRMEWPPRILVHDVEKDPELLKEIGKHNAFAFLNPENQCRPEVGITVPLLNDVVQNDADRLAFVLGHELAHLTLRHTKCKSMPRPVVLMNSITRVQEYAADLQGMQYALAASYSLGPGLQAYRKLDELFGYTSFEALSSDHPAVKDRLARMDKDQAALWRSMSAFENGAMLLSTEHYASAEASFRRVVEVFPKSHEAWMNLGYSLLMQYADALEPDDIRKLDVGHIALGGFYKRPESLENEVKRLQKDLWREASEALREANRLAPESALIKANLGIAQLIQPESKNTASAFKLLKDAALISERDKNLSNADRASIWVNYSVAAKAAANAEEFTVALNRAQALVKKARQYERPQILGPLSFNRATLLAGSRSNEEQLTALSNIESYLNGESSSSAWWPLAYDLYKTLCGETGTPVRPSSEFASNRLAVREVVSVELAKGNVITLGDAMKDLTARLGDGTPLPIAGELARRRYPQHGLDLIGDDQLLAIVLWDAKAPSIDIRRTGVSAGETKLRVGDRFSLVEASAYGRSQSMPFFDPTEVYDFFPALGIAIVVDKQREQSGSSPILEMVIVQAPRMRR